MKHLERVNTSVFKMNQTWPLLTNLYCVLSISNVFFPLILHEITHLCCRTANLVNSGNYPTFKCLKIFQFINSASIFPVSSIISKLNNQNKKQEEYDLCIIANP